MRDEHEDNSNGNKSFMERVAGSEWPKQHQVATWRQVLQYADHAPRHRSSDKT